MSAFLLVFLLFSVLVPIPSLSVSPTVSEASSWEDYPDYPLPLPVPEDPLTFSMIVISSDGTITPSDAPITVEKIGVWTIFRLTRDIILTGGTYQIRLGYTAQCGLVIEGPEAGQAYFFDGGGHVIYGPGAEGEEGVRGICVAGTGNPTYIMNVSVTNFNIGIFVSARGDHLWGTARIYKSRIAGNSVGVVHDVGRDYEIRTKIINNVIDQNGLGTWGSEDSIIMGNVFAFNEFGIVTGYPYNTITYNKFISNEYGMSLYSRYNTVILNSFINNEFDVDPYSDYRNTWYDESRGLGNYWSSYAQGCSDVDGDFVCDDPYGYDHYPLKVPVEQLPDPPVDDIFIFPDGSVWPSWAQITRTSSNYYVLTRDLTPPRSKPTLIIMKPGITVDGNNHALVRVISENERIYDVIGILIEEYVENVTIKRFILDGHWYGIYSSSPKTTISGNTIRNAGEAAIYLEYVRDAVITNNVIEGSDEGIFVLGAGLQIWGFSNVLIKCNTIGAVRGITLEGSDPLSSFGVVIANNYIYLDTVRRSWSHGIHVENVGNVTIIYNKIENFDDLIDLWDSSDINITNNILRYGYNGIYVSDITNLVIVGNNITDNDSLGIDFYYVEGDVKIYHNVFANNYEHVDPPSTSVLWDNGYPDGGNFWDDFSPVCVDSDSDGICDDPYVIDDNNIDRYPLARVPSWSLPDVCQSAEEPGTGEAPGEGGGGVGTGRSGGMGGKALTTPETIIAIPTLITAATTATILLRRKR